MSTSAVSWLSAGACPVFVAVTECKIRVHTLRQIVLINTNFWPRVQCLCPYCSSITSGSVSFRSVLFQFLYGWLDRLHLVLTGWAEDGHAANLCICIRAKNTAQSLLETLVSAVEKCRCHQKCCGCMGCAVRQ